VADIVEIVLALRNVRQFVSGADKASGAITGVGKSTEKAGKQAGLGWKGVAKWAGAAGVVYGATRFLKGAVDQTETLGKSTLALNRTTGLDIKTSSEWAAVLKTRGVQTNMFQRGLVKLSKEMEKSRKGTATQNMTLANLGRQYDAIKQAGGKDAPKALDALEKKMSRATIAGEKSRAVWTRLGVSMDAIKRGDVQQVILQASDAFSRMKNPAERAAIAQQLFSRQATQLAPLLFKGSDAIREQLGLADKYGATLSGKSAKAIAEEMQHQRELKLAYMGVQVQLGQALLPIILQVSKLLVKLAEITAPLTHNSTALAIAIGFVAAAFVAYKVILIATTLAEIEFNAALLVTVGWIGLVVLALVALGVGIYLLIKHWDAVKRAALVAWAKIRGALAAALAWVRANWPLLVGILAGPFGLAVVLIIKNFDKIKAAAKALVDFVIRQFKRMLDFITSVPGKITGILGKAGGVAGKALGFASSHIPFGQYGANVQQAGSMIVGERGPELVALPGGATVSPLSSSAPGSLQAGAFGTAHITTEVVLDRRVLAQAVGLYTADKMARR
jgi:hypothetical protein